MLNAFGNSPSGLALWGNGAYRNLSGDADGVDWEGNVVSGHLGTDVLLKRNLLAGLSLSHSKGTLDYTEKIGVDPRQGDHETTLTSLSPYAGWMLDSGIGVWAMAGHGWGRVRINHDDADGASTSDLTQWSGRVGANGTVYSSSELLPGGETAVALKGEGALARAEVHGSADIDELTSTVSRLRVALEGKHTRRFDSGGMLTPSVELGVLADGGTGETGAGLEVGGGLRYPAAVPGTHAGSPRPDADRPRRRVRGVGRGRLVAARSGSFRPGSFGQPRSLVGPAAERYRPALGTRPHGRPGPARRTRPCAWRAS